jgi:NADH-quinone oxidoreductase subunit N
LLIFFLVSLIGIPFTGGFFGKFYSFTAAVSGGAIALAIIGLLNSGIAAAYYLRLALAAAQRPDPDAADAPRSRVGVTALAALAFTAAATLMLGIVPNTVLHAAQSGAQTLQAPTSEPIEPANSPFVNPGPQANQ